MWHSLRYYRHSGLVIYKSKLPAPSVSMPCDYRILQSPTKEQVKLVLWETARRSLLSIKRALGISACVLAFGSPLVGQTSADTLHLSEADALRLGLERNLNLKSGRLGVDKAETDKRVSLARLFPTLSLGGQYGYALKKQIVYFGGDAPEGGKGGAMNPFAGLASEGIEMGQTHNITGSFSAQMPLVNFQLWESLKLDKLSVEQALEKVRSSEINLKGEVRKAYIGALLAEENMRVLDFSLKAMEENLKSIKLKYDKGLVAEYDYIRMKTQRDNLKPTLASAEAQRKLARMKLLVLLDYAPETPLVLTGNLLKDYESYAVQPKVKTDEEVSLEDNAALRQLRLGLRQIDEGIKVKRMEYMPSLGLSFNYTYNFASNLLHLSNHRRWSPSSNIGLSLSVPLYTGGSTRYGLKSLDLQRRQSLIQMTEAKNQLNLQRISLEENQRQAVAQYTASLQAESSARKGLSIAQVRYRSGQGTVLELNDAELALRQAELNKNQALYTLVIALCETDVLLGR